MRWTTESDPDSDLSSLRDTDTDAGEVAIPLSFGNGAVGGGMRIEVENNSSSSSSLVADSS